jgi:hypothetical protein
VSESVKLAVATYLQNKSSDSRDISALLTSPAAAKKRRAQTTVQDYGVYGKRFRSDTTAHARLIAEAVSVSKVPFSFFCGDLFRRLQEYYVGGPDLLNVSGLIVNPGKLCSQILPLRYSEALESVLSRTKDGPLSQGFTVADDGWASRRKSHYSATAIARPGLSSETTAVSPVFVTELHGVAIARNWERVILLVERRNTVAEYPDGFNVALPCRPDAFCSDSADPNTRAMQIVALRHPRVIFVPCYAHVFALICGDFTTLASHASNIASFMQLVSFFNCSSSLSLPLLRDEIMH